MNRRRAILTVAVILALGVPAALLGPAPAVEARSRTVTKTHDVAVFCQTHDADGWCYPVFSVPLKTTGKLIVWFTASATHCTPIAVRLGIDGQISGIQYPVDPGGRVGVDFTSSIAPGAHTVSVIARDWPDGCEGPLVAWGGTLKVTTSKRVRR
jgi:hypothetical protein